MLHDGLLSLLLVGVLLSEQGNLGCYLFNNFQVLQGVSNYHASHQLLQRQPAMVKICSHKEAGVRLSSDYFRHDIEDTDSQVWLGQALPVGVDAPSRIAGSV